MYLCIRRPPWFPRPSRPGARARCHGPGLIPTPGSWLTRPAFRLASPPRTLVPGAAQLWARPGRGVKPTAGRGHQRRKNRPPSCDQRCLLSCPFLKLALIIHADWCSPGRCSAVVGCAVIDARQGRTPAVSVHSSSGDPWSLADGCRPTGTAASSSRSQVHGWASRPYLLAGLMRLSVGVRESPRRYAVIVTQLRRGARLRAWRGGLDCLAGDLYRSAQRSDTSPPMARAVSSKYSRRPV